jgi:hypothetical protein
MKYRVNWDTGLTYAYDVFRLRACLGQLNETNLKYSYNIKWRTSPLPSSFVKIGPVLPEF